MEGSVTELHLTTDLSQQYERLAAVAGSSREAVMISVLQAYLDQLAEEDARVQAAVAATERGEVVDLDVVHAEAEALIAPLSVSAEQRATIRAEVQAEAAATYGLPRCE